MKDLICFSHLRWDFVFQRPQHLMTRFAAQGRVFYIEEPVFSNIGTDKWIARKTAIGGVQVLVPELSNDLTGPVNERVRALVDAALVEYAINDYILWYYFPLALSFSAHLTPTVTVYDCMDELSAFKGAAPELISVEQQLFQQADIVFTGGYRLYEAKKKQHRNIYPFPSSIDKDVFSPARKLQPDPPDQAAVAHPRLGFFGVIDERFDTLLVKEMAELKPDWHFVFVGPVVKIDPADLPKLPNIHYMGIKDYKQLPQYISGWDICIMPFAINASTEFISPTKTPEFLAAGKRVISTPIHDVVHPYGDKGLVGIAGNAETFISIAGEYLSREDHMEWLTAADAFLADMSWDKTFSEMQGLIDRLEQAKSIVHKLNEGEYV